MRPFKTLSALLLLSVATLLHAEFADAQREVILYQSGRWSFNGYIYKPEGKGPFPVVVWSHGHREHLTKHPPVEYDELAKLYTRDGFILFIPDRHVHDISRSEYSAELQRLLENSPEDAATKQKQVQEELDLNAGDIIAAVDWLKQQSYTDTKHIALSGWSTGASASLAAVAKGAGIRALALFSPGIVQWRGNSLVQASLKHSAQGCALPTFLVQAKDDPSREAFDVLSKELKANNASNRAEIYDHKGFEHNEKDALAINATDTWGYDVLRFLQQSMKD